MILADHSGVNVAGVSRAGDIVADHHDAGHLRRQARPANVSKSRGERWAGSEYYEHGTIIEP